MKDCRAAIALSLSNAVLALSSVGAAIAKPRQAAMTIEEFETFMIKQSVLFALKYQKWPSAVWYWSIYQWNDPSCENEGV